MALGIPRVHSTCHPIVWNRIATTTTGTGSGGTSVYGMLYGEQVPRCSVWEV